MKRTRVLGGRCKNGHLLTPDNATVLTGGYVRCRVCQRERERRAHNRQPRHYNRLGGTCQRNHLLTLETAVRRSGSGGWQCVACHTAAAARRTEGRTRVSEERAADDERETATMLPAGEKGE